MGKHIHFADAIRAIGAILILLCHYTEQSSNVWMQMTAQFFNTGYRSLLYFLVLCLVCKEI